MPLSNILNKIASNQRLSAEDALFLVTRADFITLGKLAKRQAFKAGDRRVSFYVANNTNSESGPAPQSWPTFIATLSDLRAHQNDSNAINVFAPTQFATSHDYLCQVAIARLFLDNIPHIQTNIDLVGLKIAQLALDFGADDIITKTCDSKLVIKAIIESQKAPYQRDDSFHEINTASTKHLIDSLAEIPTYQVAS